MAKECTGWQIVGVLLIVVGLVCLPMTGFHYGRPYYWPSKDWEYAGKPLTPVEAAYIAVEATEAIFWYLAGLLSILTGISILHRESLARRS